MRHVCREQQQHRIGRPGSNARFRSFVARGRGGGAIVAETTTGNEDDNEGGKCAQVDGVKGETRERHVDIRVPPGYCLLSPARRDMYTYEARGALISSWAMMVGWFRVVRSIGGQGGQVYGAGSGLVPILTCSFVCND